MNVGIGIGLGFPSGLRLGPNLVTDGDFPSWTGDDPDAPWVVYSEPEDPGHEEVTEAPGGGARIFSDAGTIGLQQYNAGFVSGERYLVKFQVKAANSGSLFVRFGASNVYEASTEGWHTAIINAVAVNLQMYVVGGGDIVINNVAAHRIY